MFDVLSHFMLFYCKISLLCDLRCFVAKSVLSRFTRFGVEKNWANNFVCGEKRTNIRYVVVILWILLSEEWREVLQKKNQCWRKVVRSCRKREFHRRAYHPVPATWAACGCPQSYKLLENSTDFNTHIFCNRRRPESRLDWTLNNWWFDKGLWICFLKTHIEQR